MGRKMESWTDNSLDKLGPKKGGGWGMLVLVCLLLALPCWIAYYRTFQWVPEPAPDTAYPFDFSEQRALRHVHDLVNGIGDRQISSPGLSLATKYILEQVKAIAAIPLPGHRMEVQVDLETVSGAVGMSFTGINFTNAYRRLDNVILKISPMGLQGFPAVLVSSHYDSAVCSKGASDDASQVAVMLELARTIVSRGDRLPPSPVIFLWTGGEEAISPASNGWVKHSKHFKQVGAFINLESMGGGGVPIIFQHTGSWVLNSFVSGAPNPRGSRIAQDIFDLHLIPADSDFRMLSARHYGSLPGIDIAFVLDSTAYHSYLDTPERLRPGNLQEMGNALMGGLSEVSLHLTRQHVMDAHPSAVERSVYFDVLGYCMVRYPDSMAYTIHNVPLVLLLASPLVQAFTEGRPVGHGYLRLAASTLRGLMTVCGAILMPALLGVARVLLLGKPMVFYAHHWLAPALFVPVALAGALGPWHRIRLNARRNEPGRRGSYLASQMHGCGLVSCIIGSSLTAAGLMGTASVFSWCGMVAFILGLIMQGPHVSGKYMLVALSIAFLPVAVAASNVGIYVVVLLERMSMSGAGVAVLADVVVGVMHGATLLAASCGALLPLLAYAIPGGHKQFTACLVGFSLSMAAWSHIAYRPYSPAAPKRLVVNHFVVTEADPTAPAVEPGQMVAMRTVNSSIAIAGVDSTPLEQAIDTSRFKPAPATGREHDVVYPLTAMLRGINVHVPAKRAVAAAGVPAGSSGSSSGRGGVPGPSPAPAAAPEAHTPWTMWLAAQQEQQRQREQQARRKQQEAGAAAGPAAPFVQLVREEALQCTECGSEAGGHGGSKRARLYMRLYSEKPYWGILNMTGDLLDWSFTRDLAAAQAARKPGGHTKPRTEIVRLTSQDPDPSWHFWVDVHAPPASGAAAASAPAASRAADQAVGASQRGRWGVHVELSIVDLKRTEVLVDVLALLPDYTAETWLSTVYHSHWNF